MYINIYTNRPWAYCKLLKLLQNYDCNSRFISESAYIEGDFKILEDDVLIADPKLLETDDKILNRYRKFEMKKYYIIAAPIHPEAIIYEICCNTGLKRLETDENTEDVELIRFDKSQKNEMISIFTITEKIRERIRCIEDIALDYSNLKDDDFTKGDKYDIFREELTALVMRLSDILLAMKAKGFADGSFEAFEIFENSELSEASEKFDADFDKSRFNLKETTDEVYNKEDETSLYYDHSIQRYTDINKEAC